MLSNAVVKKDLFFLAVDLIIFLLWRKLNVLKIANILEHPILFNTSALKIKNSICLDDCTNSVSDADNSNP